MKLFIILSLSLLELVTSSMFKMERGSSLRLVCPGPGDDDPNTEYEPADSVMEPNLNISVGKPGERGPQGPQGPPGPPGAQEPDSEIRRRYGDKISELEAQVQAQQQILDKAGSILNPTESCKVAKLQNPNAKNGLYYIKDSEENLFVTYCDMEVDSGGWTLVASIHENNMKGRCTSGDRWSTEQGNGPQPHGDGFWENRAIHGSASSSTSDDYKSPAYFTMKAQDIMIWHVPNDTPMHGFNTSAFLKYYTTDAFLQRYGGNLQALYSTYYPVRQGHFDINNGNGPAIPITWEVGSNAKMIELTAVNARAESEPGYIQFRALNHQRDSFALCPGVRKTPGKHNVEHFCIGSSSTDADGYCGDFAAKDWTGGWGSPNSMITSVVMIFYR